MFYGIFSAIVALIILIFNEYSYTNSGGAFGANIFIITAVVLVYFLTKLVIAHKAERRIISMVDFFIERLVAPLMVIILTTRYTSLTVDAALTSSKVWFFLVLLTDPGNGLKNYLCKLKTIKSGHFLHPIISEHAKSNIDYFQVYLALLVCYLALWWK